MRILFIALCTSLASCNYNHVKQAADKGPILSAAALSNPDFDLVNRVVFIPKCVSCHSQSGRREKGLSLERYEDIRLNAPLIRFRSVEVGNMPAGGLGGVEKELLKNWFDNGTPLQVIAGEGEKPSPEIGGGPTDFKKVSGVLFAPKCNSCHSVNAENPQQGPDGNLDLTDLKAVRAKRLEIYDRVIFVGDMPKSPYPAVTLKEKEMLEKWFNSGMPE